MTQHHIVVISESQRLQGVMQSALADDTLRVSGFSPSSGDLHVLATLRPDLLILDWVLGSEDHGLQVLQILRLFKPLSDLPIIVCSAPIDLVREIAEGVRDSAVQFLLKPFALPELQQALYGALGLAPAEAAVQGRSPSGGANVEIDAARWRPVSARDTPRHRGEWEWHTRAAAAPTETPLTDEPAALSG
jgi:DNA-binding response OmpR family regulator